MISWLLYEASNATVPLKDKSLGRAAKITNNLNLKMCLWEMK